jgi:homoserine dehydrogenase
VSRLRVALLGFGDVGQALARQLLADAGPVTVTSVTDTTGTLVDPDGLDLAGVLEAKREAELASGPGRRRPWSSREAARRAPADAVVQLTPSDLGDPERGLAELRAALEAGRSVVTAAKDALACRPEAIARARSPGTQVRSSAAVGGSTPALELLDAGFGGDQLEHLAGVLNGSTTFVLSRMEQGDGFGQALDEAREAGLLEADPKTDLLGHDAAAKAAILHQRAYGSQLRFADVDVEGVAGIEPEACRQARRRGTAIRLLAHVDPEGARVAPVQLPAEDALALEGPRACLRLSFARAGEIELAGPGAGPRETAGAVLSDLHRLAQAPAEADPSPDRRAEARARPPPAQP